MDRICHYRLQLVFTSVSTTRGQEIIRVVVVVVVVFVIAVAVAVATFSDITIFWKIFKVNRAQTLAI